MAQACLDAWGRIDFLQNNVGIGAGDAEPLRLTEEAFDHVIAVNLKGCLLPCQAIVSWRASAADRPTGCSPGRAPGGSER